MDGREPHGHGHGHGQAVRVLAAPPEAVFDFLDDPQRLVAHMARPTLMMAYATLRLELDAGGGRAVGSVMRLRGRFLAWPLEVDEAVVERQPPRRKAWQTLGSPRLIVLAGYRMGFDVDACEGGSHVTIWIDYALPNRGLPALLGRRLGAAYARWCVDRMMHDAARHFGVSGES